ncbi:MAG: hypothetical protein KDD62_16000, partial [Bdellovibrionales bacterium]|nr:hypothetical protein [Bdellovibrionales bacterium]
PTTHPTGGVFPLLVQYFFTFKPPLFFFFSARLQGCRDVIAASKILNWQPNSLDRCTLIMEAYCLGEALDSLRAVILDFSPSSDPDLLQSQLAETVSFVMSAMHPSNTEDSSFFKLKTGEFNAASQFFLYCAHELVNVSNRLSKAIDINAYTAPLLEDRLRMSFQIDEAETYGFGPTKILSLVVRAEQQRPLVSNWQVDHLISPTMLFGKKWQVDLKSFNQAAALELDDADQSTQRYLAIAIENFGNALNALDKQGAERTCFVPLIQRALLECQKCPSDLNHTRTPRNLRLFLRQQLEQTFTLLLRCSWGDPVIKPLPAPKLLAVKEILHTIGWPHRRE